MKEFKKDLSKWKEYDYVVINDDLKNCYKEILKIIKNKNQPIYDKDFIKKYIKKLIN